MHNKYKILEKKFFFHYDQKNSKFTSKKNHKIFFVEYVQNNPKNTKNNIKNTKKNYVVKKLRIFFNHE